jgi:hypothetical protein
MLHAWISSERARLISQIVHQGAFIDLDLIVNHVAAFFRFTTSAVKSPLMINKKRAISGALESTIKK